MFSVLYVTGPARVDHRGRPVIERASEFTARVSPMVGPQQSQQQVNLLQYIPLQYWILGVGEEGGGGVSPMVGPQQSQQQVKALYIPPKRKRKRKL